MFLCWVVLSGIFKAGWAQVAPAVSMDSPAPGEEALPYKYVGNIFSLKFHRPSCPFAKVMASSHRELFHFRRQAVEAGLKPCRYCLPPVWTNVRGKILVDPRAF